MEGWPVNGLIAAASSSLLPWLREWLPVLAAGTIALVAVLTLRRAIRSDDKEEARWKGSMDEFKESASKKLETIDRRLRNVETTVLQLVGWYQREGVLKVNSPMTLNTLGEKVWRELDAANWLRRHAAEVSAQVKWLSEYDVQEFCFNYMSRLDLEPRHRNLVRQAAYRNGLTEFQVRQIMAIKLRDALLSMCPVCGEDATRNPPGGDWLRWNCTSGCGDFRLTGSAAAVLRGGDRDLDVERVRDCLTAKREEGCDSPMIGAADLEDLTTPSDPVRVAD